MQNQVPQPIFCKAAIAYKPKKPMVIEEICVAPPKAGEIRVKVISNALSETDIHHLDGLDTQSQFPCILGHEATAIVQSIGEGVTRLKPGDIITPSYVSQCDEKNCIFCKNPKTNLCPKLGLNKWKGLMPDGTSRFTSKEGKTIYHFMGCSTFSQYTVLPEISVAKINPNADLNKICLLGCGVSTGWGAVINTVDLQPGKSVAVWGLGAVGLSVIQAAKIRGAIRIYAIDINPEKFPDALKMGATTCFSPNEGKSGKTFLLQQEKYGIDYTFQCTGNTALIRQALESSHRGFGKSCIIGISDCEKEFSTRSFQLVTGRNWIGTVFGGWKTLDIPKLVNKVELGEFSIENIVTHQFQSIQDVNKAVDVLKQGKCLMAVVEICPPPKTNKWEIKVLSSIPLHGGILKEVRHWSQCNNCFMNFNIFLPSDQISEQRGKPYSALYFLSGLTSDHHKPMYKSGFARHAIKHNLAFIVPDTSPRDLDFPDFRQTFYFGDAASFYVNATKQPYKKHFNMMTYVVEELPELVSTYFPVRKDNISISGFSMGGHGALICALKSGIYRSVSAFSPCGSITAPGTLWVKHTAKYFNDPKEARQYDTCEILKNGKFHRLPMLVQCGGGDQYHQNDDLKISTLVQSLKEANYIHQFYDRPLYDHTYYYVSTFLEEHFEFHAKYLKWFE